jgi:hypothetical protein
VSGGGVADDEVADPRTMAAANVGPGVEGCKDTDNTARQLCELATKEEDPFTRGNLWREYEEYVRVLEDTR